MNKLIMLALLSLSTSCNAKEMTPEKRERIESLDLRCFKIRYSLMERCENQEVICYIYSSSTGDGLSCKWKEGA